MSLTFRLFVLFRFPLLVYQVVGTMAGFQLELAHFLHGSEERIATQLRVHFVQHFSDGIDDAEIWQTMFKEGMDGLLIGSVQHGRMLFGSFQAVSSQAHRGERLIIERFERPSRGFCPIACRRDIAKSFRSGQSKRDRQAAKPAQWWHRRGIPPWSAR